MMEYFFPCLAIISIVYNLIKNKAFLATVLMIFLVVIITYGTNIKALMPSAEMRDVLKRMSFIVPSLLLVVITIIFGIKEKLSQRKIALVMIIILFAIMDFLSMPNYGGAIKEEGEYFKDNLELYISLVSVLLLQGNLCIHYVCQKLPEKNQ